MLWECAVFGDAGVEEEGGLIVADGDGDEHGYAVFGTEGGTEEGVDGADGALGDVVAGGDSVGEVVHEAEDFDFVDGGQFEFGHGGPSVGGLGVDGESIPY